MEAVFGNATQLRDVARGDPLTAPIEGFHLHLDPWVRVMKSPIPQRADVGLSQRDVNHR